MIDKQQIYQWWDVFKHGSELTEVRILDGSKTYSGYFRDVRALIQAIEPYDNYPHAQIYFTLNHIKDACYSRCPEKIIMIKREPTTGDLDIDGRTHVLIDLDPKRPAGVSSSNQELEYAHLRAVKVYRYLLEQGFNEPIICKSGNGYHVIIPCAIVVNDETTQVIKTFIQVLAMLFSDDKVDIDEKVFNPSRICKLYGVTARKGENTEERPWRQSQIVKVPKEIKPTDIAYFKKVAALMPKDEPKPAAWNNYQERFDLVEFLMKHSIGYKAERVAGGTKYILDHCPFNDQHKHKDAVIFQRDNGAIGFICLHNSCSDKTWKDVRLLFEPDAYQKQFNQYQPQRQRQPYAPSQPAQPIVQTDDKGKIWLKMSDIRKQPFSMSDFIPSGIIELDRKGLGFKRGMVSIWTGKRGCGKSSIFNMLILNAAQKKYKSALWTGELTGDMVKQWLYLQAAGKQYNERYQNTDYYVTQDCIVEKIDEWIDKYFWLFNNKYGDNFSQIEEQIRKLVTECQVDEILLDNLMVLDIRALDENKYDRQAVLLQKLEDLAKELNIHIHLVAHPHKSLGYIRIDNISGSGDIANKADNIFIMSRVNNDFRTSAQEYLEKMEYESVISSGCTNIVEIGKFRAKGTLMGSVIKLWFEEESNRLKNDIAENVIYNWNESVLAEEQPISYQQPAYVPLAPQVSNDMPFAAPTGEAAPF